jgi:hypothetical protein
MIFGAVIHVNHESGIRDLNSGSAASEFNTSGNGLSGVRAYSGAGVIRGTDESKNPYSARPKLNLFADANV